VALMNPYENTGPSLPAKNCTLDGPVQIGYLPLVKIGPPDPVGFSAVVFSVFF